MARKNKKTILLIRVLTVVGVFAIAGGIVDNYSQISIKNRELETLKAEYVAQEAVNLDIQRTIQLTDSKDYIEKIARDKLGFVYPDEKIFIDVSGK